MSDLFRKEALEAKRDQGLGDVILSQPLSQLLITGFLVAIVTTAILFLSVGTYARKETVQGFLSPDKGIVKVHTPRPGVIGQLLVVESQSVKAGDPLLTLLGDTMTGSGQSVDGEMQRVIDFQLAEIQTRQDLEVRRREADAERLAAEIRGLTVEIRSVLEQVSTQRQLLSNLQKNYDRLGGVVKKGFISTAEYLEREAGLIGNRQLLANLLQKHAAITASVEQKHLELARVPLESDERLSRLASSRADLELRKIDFSSKRSITISAPLSGKVAAIQAIVGSTVSSDYPLLTILPAGGRLEAQLFVPTRAVGFVARGQEVRLLYDAFDFRQFGVQKGTISAISSTVLSPLETGTNVRVSEPTYRVTVTIESETVNAFGQEFPLQAGMLLAADIVLEKRSLLDWILEPLLSLRGRT